MSACCRVTEPKTDNGKTAKTKTQTATNKKERKKRPHAARHADKKLHSTRATHCKLAIDGSESAHTYT